MLSEEQVKAVMDKYIRDYNIVEVPAEWITVFFKQCYVQFLFGEKTVEIYDGIKNKWKLTYSELEQQLDKLHKTGGFWDRNYNMLKELLSLAMTDGECPQTALDQPFEFRDQARCILQSHAVGQSVEEAEKTCITEDGFARIYASELVIVIQPEEELMHISMLKPNPETHTHGLPEWENMDAEDFPRGIYGYVWWTQNLKPALFEIIELLESPDTSSESPPITCEETENEEVIQLRKQVEELQGRLSEYEQPLEKLLEMKNATFQSLHQRKIDCDKQINELKDVKSRLSGEMDCLHNEMTAIKYRIRQQKGVTSDS